MEQDNNDNIIEENENKTAVAVMDKEELIIHEYTDSEIQGMIYEIRGQQVMLDSDLAKLYDYNVKRLNEQVKRNIDRFPDDFMFQLTEEEMIELSRSQIATSIQTAGIKGGRSYKIYVFTEQGVNQLSAVLKSPIAVKQSVLIIRTFVKMRHYFAENRQFLNGYDILRIESRLNNTEQALHKMATKDDINNINDKIQNIMDNFIVTDKVKEFAFLKGDKFEADELFIKIYNEAKHNIYIVDNYISMKTLSHLKHKSDHVNVVIFTTNAGGRDKLRKAEFDDFNLKYPSLVLKSNPLSHDRYIILDYNTDNEKIYHSGASIKDAGQKVCSVNEITDKQIYHSMIDSLLLESDINL